MDVLEKYIEVISKGLKKTLADADPKARTFSRCSLEHMSSKFPGEARNLFDSLDATTKKQLASVMGGGMEKQTMHSPLLQKQDSKKNQKLFKQMSGKEDDESITKDSEKQIHKTPNSKIRTLSTKKKMSEIKSINDVDAIETQHSGKHQRKKSLTNTGKREKGNSHSMKSVDKPPTVEPKKSPVKVNKPVKSLSSMSDGSIEYRNILHKLDSQVILDE